MTRVTSRVHGTVATTGLTVTVAGAAFDSATVIQPAYHVTVDTTEAETQRILDDPKVAADVRQGLADIEHGALRSFEDVFGEPQ